MTTSTRELLLVAADQLTAAGVESARHDAETLLSHTLGLDRAQLLTRDGITAEEAARFSAALARRAGREPLQHITASSGFRYLDLDVGPGVFIPRPETEVMAGSAVAELRRLVDAGVAEPRAVDLCTGSGAVAAALATEVPGVRVTAVEVSRTAYAYALRNTRGLDIEVRLGDMADMVDDLAGAIDLVTANPPYIPLSVFESVAVEVRDFDPPEALWSGPDGLDAIAVVARVAAMLLVDGGLVVCEHADVQSESATAMFASSGAWTQVRDNCDLAGRPRFVSARRVSRPSGPAGTITL